MWPTSWSFQISPEGVNALRLYQYRGTDKSYLYKYVLSPWAQYCVDKFTPTWTAPNVITLIGLVLQAVAMAAAWAYSPLMTNTELPGWTGVLAAFSLFTYSTLDNMDGKQARRTGSSSPLGLLFDHGCDALNASLIGWVTVAMLTAADAGTWKPFALFCIPTIPFFINTWEEYHTGELVLPVINGPNEGLMGTVTFSLLTAFFGQGMWSAEHISFPPLAWALTPVVDAMRWLAGEQLVLASSAGAPSAFSTAGAYLSHWLTYPTVAPGGSMSNLETLIGGLAISVILTITFQTVNVATYLYKVHANEPAKRNSAIRSALSQQLYMWALIGVTTMWLHTPECHSIIKHRWWMFYGSAGMLAADMTSKLMVAHVTSQEWKPFTSGIVLFAAAPILVRFWPFPGWTEQRAAAQMLLLFTFAVCVLDLSSFLYTSVLEIAAALDIDVFDISKQVARAAARATSVIEGAAKPQASPRVVAAAAKHEGVKPFTAPASASEAEEDGEEEEEEDEQVAAPAAKQRGGARRKSVAAAKTAASGGGRGKRGSSKAPAAAKGRGSSKAPAAKGRSSSKGRK